MVKVTGKVLTAEVSDDGKMVFAKVFEDGDRDLTSVWGDAAECAQLVGAAGSYVELRVSVYGKALDGGGAKATMRIVEVLGVKSLQKV